MTVIKERTGESVLAGKGTSHRQRLLLAGTSTLTLIGISTFARMSVSIDGHIYISEHGHFYAGRGKS